MEKATARLQNQEVVGMVQTWRPGLDWNNTPVWWSKANKKDRKDLVVARVTKIEQEKIIEKSLAQRQRG